MMNNITPDHNRIPQPEDKIVIESLKATPYPDRWRVRIEIKVTPFQKRPNLLLVARNANNQLVGELDVIETMHTHMEFTMHIRNIEEPAGTYELTADLFYETRNPSQDKRTMQFIIPEIEKSSD